MLLSDEDSLEKSNPAPEIVQGALDSAAMAIDEIDRLGSKEAASDEAFALMASLLAADTGVDNNIVDLSRRSNGRLDAVSAIDAAAETLLEKTPYMPDSEETKALVAALRKFLGE